MYIARRLVRFASEDIGNADPQALTVTMAARDAVHFLGFPEANTALAQAAIYLATAPKSNAVYMAYGAAAEARRAGRRRPGAAAPAQRADEADEAARLRQGAIATPTTTRTGVADMDCLPRACRAASSTAPTDRGFEKEIKRRLDGWKEIKKATRAAAAATDQAADRRCGHDLRRSLMPCHSDEFVAAHPIGLSR